ncbi:DMT family transporter [Amphritea sp. HPY]|uniref:DMT family transporter n=1 Tax=Amphritea sp. HPY TaxID=3421652 RepID=UPI003D7C5CD6
MFTVAIWGLNVVVMKIGVTDMAPLLFTGMRFVLLSLLLLPFVKIPRTAIRQVIGLAMIMGVGHFCVLSIGLRYVDSVVAGLILLLGAPLSSLLAFIFLNERLRVLQMVAVCIAGLGAIVPTLLEGAVDIQAGALLILLCVLMWAIGNLKIRNLSNLPLLTLQFWIGFISAPLCLLAYWLNPAEVSLAAQFTSNSMLSLVYVVCGSSILAYWLWYQLIKRHGINSVVNFVLLQPVVTMVAGYLILGELMSGLQLAGGAVTLLAMWGFYHSGKRPV